MLAVVQYSFPCKQHINNNHNYCPIKSNQIKFISLKNSIHFKSGIIAVSRNSKAKVALTAVLDRPTNITGLHINY